MSSSLRTIIISNGEFRVLHDENESKSMAKREREEVGMSINNHALTCVVRNE